MNPSDLTRSILVSLGGIAEEVTLYPVRASEIDAYLGADLLGTAARGIIDVRSALDGSGDVDVQTEIHVFSTDSQTAAPIMPRHWSLQYGDVRYDILRKAPDHPGGVDCYLQEYR